MSVLAVAVAALAAAAVTGCGSEDEPINCSFTGPASALVGGGTSQTGFLSLNDGDDMIVVLGPQGLYMLTPSVRVQNMYPGQSGRTGHASDPEIVTELYMGGDLIGGSARANLGMTQTADGGAEALGIFSPFTAELSEYLGQIVTVRGEVSDACGRSASDELDVLVRQ